MFDKIKKEVDQPDSRQFGATPMYYLRKWCIS